MVVADDAFLLREAVVHLLESTGRIEIVAAVGTLDDLLAAVARGRPDAVLTDIRMPPTSTDEGVRAAHALRRSHPDVGVVVLSQHLEPAYAVGLFDEGSHGRGYLLKERVSASDELVDALETVAGGGSVVDPRVVETLVSQRRAPDSLLRHLTPREHQVLTEMAEGRNNAAIGARLGLPERAVEKHSNAVFAKLCLTQEPDVNRRVKAVLLFLAEHR